MRSSLIQAVLVGGLLAGCAAQSSIKPSEVLDERTGMTVGALQAPIEFIEAGQNMILAEGKRASFAYLGPVEWDNSGDISYGLWLHVAPGNDRQVGDVRSKGAVTLHLDDGPLALTPLQTPPPPGSGPYRPIASWGQTIYFQLDVGMLKRMATSQKLEIDFHGADQSEVDFTPTRDTRSTLTQFMHARGITAD
jgi:hypothetical protein